MFWHLALHSGMPPATTTGFSMLVPVTHVAGKSQFAEEEKTRT
jgi:hypothetical protein